MTITAIKDKNSCYFGLSLDSKKNAEEELDREIAGNVAEVEAVNTGDKRESSMEKRSRKRKSYGDDFEESEEQMTREKTDGMAFNIFTPKFQSIKKKSILLLFAK